MFFTVGGTVVIQPFHICLLPVKWLNCTLLPFCSDSYRSSNSLCGVKKVIGGQA